MGGSRKDGELYYPKMGSGITMFAGSKIIGKCRIGDNVVCSANSMIINQDIEADCIVFGCSPNIEIKGNNKTQRELLGLYS